MLFYVLLVLAVLFDLAVMFAITALYAMIGGYVFATLWGWFVVSTLQLPPLPLVDAIGMMIIFNHLTGRVRYSEFYRHFNRKMKPDMSSPKIFWRKELKSTLKHIVLYAAHPLLALIAGWLIHLFM